MYIEICTPGKINIFTEFLNDNYSIRTFKIICFFFILSKNFILFSDNTKRSQDYYLLT